MNTTDKNLDFANFLEWKTIKPFGSTYVIIPTDLYKPTTIRELEDGVYDFKMESCDLEFHTNWNWIIEVVKKIKTLKFDNSEEKNLLETSLFIIDGALSKLNLSLLNHACHIYINYYNIKHGK